MGCGKVKVPVTVAGGSAALSFEPLASSKTGGNNAPSDRWSGGRLGCLPALSAAPPRSRRLAAFAGSKLEAAAGQECPAHTVTSACDTAYGDPNHSRIREKAEK